MTVVGSGLSLVLSWAVRLSFSIGLWMLFLDPVTMTMGEGGRVRLVFWVIEMIGGSSIGG